MAEFDNNDFSSIKIGLASADQIRSWSAGEVKKPETINYRTLKPEKDGLFCEKIFGPTKDFECSCGKYKGMRFKGIVCERCGVEVTTAKVRRDRMGHIELAAPVSHIWYFKGSASSPMATLLEIKNKDLEKVLYFASNIITRIDTDAREEDAEDLREELEADLEELDAEYERQAERIRNQNEEDDEFVDEPLTPEEIAEEIADLKEEIEDEKWLRNKAFEEFMSLTQKDLVSDEVLFREMRKHYSIYFDGGMGAEAVRELLGSIDLHKLADELRVIVDEGKGQKRAKAVKRLEVVDAFIKGSNNPTNMILDVVPVIPPDLRPMVQLDGGRFAASDLNDLYRRVINRNNRLKRLLDLDAPAIIVNNEKRMLQEAVDALFDNGRRGRPVTGRGGRPLKSLAESLKGKQGRFRQNLLGKRVDYSGRSVIVVDPQLKLHQCGLPKAMALELFKPFVMKRLVETGKAENIKGAKRAIDRGNPYVWDVLEEIITDRLVLLNRAPTLHRLSIQAFEPVLVEGKAIHLHPLVCAPFNADFDGDQMSVHVPLSAEAQAEARVLMLSANNLRSPASGKVLTVPSQDMIIGMYYVTTMDDLPEGAHPHAYASFKDAENAYQARAGLELHTPIEIRLEHDCVVWDSFNHPDGAIHKAGERILTTVGRSIFNACLPDDYPFVNYQIKKKDVAALVNDCCDKYPLSQVEFILDSIKSVGFHYATRAGLTISVWDAVIPHEKKAEILARADEDVAEIDEQAEEGLVTIDERRRTVIDVWNAAAQEVAREMERGFEKSNPIYMMADSGARGSITQLRQLAGMRGLMADVNTKKVLNTKKPLSPETDPRDLKVIGPDAIELPIKSNFREGLSTLEYFISTYGARKGLVDTASHTSDSGYLTRRLIDVAQDVIVREYDCGTNEGVAYDIFDEKGAFVSDLVGRCVFEPIADPETGELLAEVGSYIASVENVDDTSAMRPSLRSFADAGITSVMLRSVVTCSCRQGVCQKCYGWDLSNRRPVNIGTAVGAIAAQSIGEPGTQLTMRTIHSGGVAGEEDITQGLPFVSRAFNIVSVKNSKIVGGREALLSTVSGRLSYGHEDGEAVLSVINPETGESFDARVSERDVADNVYDGMEISAGDQITKGFVDFKQLRALTDTATTMHRFVKTVKDVYTGQGVELNEKHIEVIARQMLRRVRVTDTGDSNYLLNQYVDRHEFEAEVNRLKLEGKTDEQIPKAQPVILGIVRAAMASDSWLASASFERTAEVLTKAAIEGKQDHLADLKANVIIGKRIPAGTGIDAYRNVPLTYKGQLISTETRIGDELPEWAPAQLHEIEAKIPRQPEWVNGKNPYGFDGGLSHNGHILAPEDAKLYLFDDLGVSQRWTNKFSEVGIETVGDLIGKTEDELLRIDGIGAKAIEELREGLEVRDLLYILEPDDSLADDEDISQLLEMVFSPDGEDILLGTSVPSLRHYDDEMIGGAAPQTTTTSSDDIINENYESLDALLNFTRNQRALDNVDDDEMIDGIDDLDDLSALDALLLDDEPYNE
ncbi:MAG: DNA-directed RNA polymerase subunit beta' [Coriobacteriales bacterium]|nr:DNA-directed RNA polymerase subunit beta' [Coriobacteriales bacterium]